MSDHDETSDPMDKAYAQAEAMLNDDDARAARRARVLGAVATQTPAPSPAAVAPPSPQRRWPRGRWLIAAGVGGFSLLFAQLYEPSRFRPPPADLQEEPAATATADQAASPQMAAPPAEPQLAPPAPVARAREESRSITAAPAAAPPAPAAPPPPSMVSPAAPPPPPMAAAAPAAAPMRAGEASDAAAVRSQSQRAPAFARGPAAESLGAGSAAPGDQAARLRAAAAAGRVRDVAALLGDGAVIDAADDQGETALMKAVRANHPAVASLLRRRGASLDLRNRAGQTARDMAASVGDAELDRALGTAP